MELLAPLSFTLKHRPGKAGIIPDILSRREQDRPHDATDARIASREQILLSPKLWVNNMIAKDLICPFSDDHLLRSLWTQALNSGECIDNYLKAYTAVKNK